jgi:hypothetical protein
MKGEGIWGDGHFFSLYSRCDMPTVQCYLIALPASLLHRQSLIARRVNALFGRSRRRAICSTQKKFIEVSRLRCVYGSVAEKGQTHFFSVLSFRFHLCSIGRLKIKFFCTSTYDEWLLSTINFWWRKMCTLMAWVWHCVIFEIYWGETGWNWGLEIITFTCIKYFNWWPPKVQIKPTDLDSIMSLIFAYPSPIFKYYKYFSFTLSPRDLIRIFSKNSFLILIVLTSHKKNCF